MEKFSIEEAVSFGWKTFKTRPWFFIGVTIVLCVISGLGNNISRAFHNDGVGLILAIAFWVFSMIATIGALKIYLMAEKGERPEFEEMVKHSELFVNFFFCSLLLGLIVGFGIVLLIIPGVIFAVRLGFAPLFVVDGGLGPVDALKRSWEMTRGHALQLFLLTVVLGLVMILGFIALFVGIFVAMPVVYLAYVHVYRKLLAGAPAPAV